MRSLLIVPIALLALAPAAAHASTASKEGATITVVGGPESSDISFPGGGEYYVRDLGGITAGAGCEQREPTLVSCGFPSAGPLDAVNADLGAGDDKYILVGSYAQVVNGGPGNDSIDTGAMRDVVHGDDGDDYVSGGPDADRIFGDAGNDEVRGHNDGDDVDGGAGRDVLIGDGGDATKEGSDRIATRDGEVDQVSCGFGADVVTADDTDVIEGAGMCESVDAQPVSGGGGSTGGGEDITAPALALSAKRSVRIATAVKRPGYPVGVVVGEASTLTVTLAISALNARKYGLGRGTFTLDTVRSAVSADSYAVGLWATGSKAKKLKTLARRRGFRKIPAVITASAVDAAGNRRTQRLNVSLTR